MHWSLKTVMGAVLALPLASAAFAQQPLYLQARSYTLDQQQATIDLTNGSSPLAWTANAVRWAFVKTGPTQENRDSVAEWLSGAGTFEPPVRAQGAAVVGVDFQPVLETLQASDINRLLPDGAPSASASATVRHYRSAAVLIRRAGPEEAETGVACTELSLSSSIHPFMDPTRLLLGGDLAFELVVRGSEVEGAKVYAKHVPTGAVSLIESETNVYHFTPSQPGQWQLVFQVARPLERDSSAKYEVFTGTLTFETPKGQEARS